MSTTTDPHPSALHGVELAQMRTAVVDAIEENLAQQANVPEGAEADAHRAARASLERALLRIDSGTYGACTACDVPIPVGRLELVPDAELCISCAQRPARLLG